MRRRADLLAPSAVVSGESQHLVITVLLYRLPKRRYLVPPDWYYEWAGDAMSANDGSLGQVETWVGVATALPRAQMDTSCPMISSSVVQEDTGLLR